MTKYQLQFQLDRRNAALGQSWYPATVTPIDWRQLLSMVKLWRNANPECPLRAVEWDQAITA